jgi:hypothetical protein
MSNSSLSPPAPGIHTTGRRWLACCGAILLGVGLTVLLNLFTAAYADSSAAASTALARLKRIHISWSSENSNTAVIASRPLTIPFPRLGMWWPNPWKQPITDIARYDWVILGKKASEFITPLKTLHPGIMLLNSTNACELHFNPDPDAEPGENQAVQAIPPEWFLTQVGSELTMGVDETTTTFHVAAITATDGLKDYALFVVSDTVLIEGESVYVKAVDQAAKTLTVQRGYVRPAIRHSAGTRLAAHISYWPNSWLLNLSTICPPAVVSSTIGPETWADYNARASVGLLANPLWDGLLIDRSDSNESWLIGNSTARTIDPDQSNTLITDYATFDAAWNAGLRRYEQIVRQAVGPSRIIFVNWGMPNYDLLNGNNFEGFPGDDTAAFVRAWPTVVLGPAKKGSYFEWMAQAQQPNLTMIETYEDNSEPAPTSNEEYDNPCNHPGFVPNYRKMRFGLATALLNDGFFSYEINTSAHGELCLLWFDEYDNAGQGRGYLGQPLGAARCVTAALPTPNLVLGSEFESQADLDQWDFEADAHRGYTATLTLDKTTAASGTASARVTVTHVAGTDWRVSFTFKPVAVISGTEYTLSFWAKADRTRPVSAWVQQDRAPWDTYLWFDSFPLTSTWQHYETAIAARGSYTSAILQFGLGQTTGVVWLDDVRLQVGNRSVWRRDYTGGAVLVNATADAQTIPLGGTFRKIKGAQAPAVNDGSLVTQVVLPPKDGLIVVRSMESRVYLPLLWKSS